MRKVHGYSIIKELKLVIQYYQEQVELPDGIAFKQEIMGDKKFRSDFNFLIDIRQTGGLVYKKNIQKYGEWLTENMILKGIRRFAVLTEKPNQVVKTTLLMLRTKHSSLSYQAFSTVDAALEWLQVDTSKKNIVDLELEYLRQSTRSLS